MMEGPLLLFRRGPAFPVSVPLSFLPDRYVSTRGALYQGSPKDNGRRRPTGLVPRRAELLGVSGWSECPPFILVARRRPGLPLASPPSQRAWLVEPGPVCRGPLGQRDRDGGCERVQLLGLSNRHV